MSFQKIDNDMLHTGSVDGKIPVIGAGDKLATALIDTGAVDGKIPVVGAGDKLANALIDTGLVDGKIPLVSTGDKLPTSLLDAGVAANQLVQLDGTAKLPALDASLLTNLPAPVGVGAMNLLETQVITSPVGQIDFTSGIDGTYDFYKIIATDIRGSASFSPSVRFYLGGVLVTSTDYHTPRTKVSNTDTNNTYYSNNDTNGNASVISPTSFNSLAGNPFSNVIIEIPSPTAVGAYKMTRNHCYMVSDSGTITLVETATVCKANASDLTGIRFYPHTGNLTRGTFKLYGFN